MYIHMYNTYIYVHIYIYICIIHTYIYIPSIVDSRNWTMGQLAGTFVFSV